MVFSSFSLGIDACTKKPGFETPSRLSMMASASKVRESCETAGLIRVICPETSRRKSFYMQIDRCSILYPSRPSLRDRQARPQAIRPHQNHDGTLHPQILPGMDVHAT